jgi:hypothetical protein
MRALVTVQRGVRAADFDLPADRPVGAIAAAIARAWQLDGSAWLSQSDRILPPDVTLAGAGIESGASLMLVVFGHWGEPIA